MVKRHEKLEFLHSTQAGKLSILESRIHNQAVVDSNSGGLQSRSTPNRIACAVKQAVTRGLRKSSSLTNGISPARNKTALREYGTEARGLNLSCNHVYAPIPGTSGEQLTTAERRKH
jgi:hypothetical protein